MLTMIRARSVFGVMSPNPTVEKTVTAKYSARVWLSCSLNVPADAVDRDREHDQKQRDDQA
jgi:hypothetical protein